MVEVFVSQHHVGHVAAGDLAHVVADCLRFSERRAGIHEQCSGAALHQTDSDVEEGQTAATHAVGQGIPVEMHSIGDQAPYTGTGFRDLLSRSATTGPNSAGSHRAPLSICGPWAQPSATRILPPSTSKTWPVTSRDSLLPNQTTKGEMFSGAIASKSSPWVDIMSAKTVSVIRVRADGAIALTVTP